MTTGSGEQRNAYKGDRAWLRLKFRARDGAVRELDLLADTGCPRAVILSEDALAELNWWPTPAIDSNFGPLNGGWVRLATPELGLDEHIQGYTNAEVIALAKRSSPDFEGLVGLPVLRLGEYGGDASAFWFRRVPKGP
jgi:hypothetical protein